MTKRLLITSASLFLLLLGCATPVQKPPTPLLIAPQLPVCSLVPCRLPGRPPLLLNDAPYSAIDETEDALTKCATQVLDCIGKQEAAVRVGQGSGAAIGGLNGATPKSQ